MGIAAILWSVWKARSDLVFNGKNPSERFILHWVGEDLALLCWWFPARDRADVDAFHSYIVARAM
jgi:hypothetical protein